MRQGNITLKVALNTIDSTINVCKLSLGRWRKVHWKSPKFRFCKGNVHNGVSVSFYHFRVEIEKGCDVRCSPGWAPNMHSSTRPSTSTHHEDITHLFSHLEDSSSHECTTRLAIKDAGMRWTYRRHQSWLDIHISFHRSSKCFILKTLTSHKSFCPSIRICVPRNRLCRRSFSTKISISCFFGICELFPLKFWEKYNKSLRTWMFHRTRIHTKQVQTRVNKAKQI